VGKQSSKQASGGLPYMVQLNALRAFAAFAVLFFHFYQLHEREPVLVNVGVLGVRLFFVLSGFLITGILLECRGVSSTRSGRVGQLRQFYVRRMLRIFPLYYLVLFITAVANVYPVRETFSWLATYTSNIYFTLRGSWNGPINPFWTLAVEEQFYLLWPWLILFVADKYLLPCIITAIFLAPVYKIIGFYLGLNGFARSVITFACLDSLGLGALLAFYRRKNPLQFQLLAQHRAYNWVGPILTIFVVTIILAPATFFFGVANDLITAILCAWIIHKASVGFGGLTGYILEAKPFLYCGTISYGIYVYHTFMPVMVREFCHRFHVVYPRQPALRFTLLGAVTILIATLSWWFFEKPINNLKKRFRYSKT
jgi:peptidoglycan/LPS O-acetylase OafA/YrhL